MSEAGDILAAGLDLLGRTHGTQSGTYSQGTRSDQVVLLFNGRAQIAQEPGDLDRETVRATLSASLLVNISAPGPGDAFLTADGKAWRVDEARRVSTSIWSMSLSRRLVRS